MPEPLVDLATFGRREMAATNVATFVIGFSMFSAFILLPNFVSLPRGLPAVLAETANQMREFKAASERAAAAAKVSEASAGDAKAAAEQSAAGPR